MFSPVVVFLQTQGTAGLDADALDLKSFTRVYTVVDGFEGNAAGGKGWKGAGLPLGAAPQPRAGSVVWPIVGTADGQYSLYSV